MLGEEKGSKSSQHHYCRTGQNGWGSCIRKPGGTEDAVKGRKNCGEGGNPQRDSYLPHGHISSRGGCPVFRCHTLQGCGGDGSKNHAHTHTGSHEGRYKVDVFNTGIEDCTAPEQPNTHERHADRNHQARADPRCQQSCKR